MLEDAAVASLDASAVPLEDAVAPPDEPVLVLPLSPHPASIVPALSLSLTVQGLHVTLFHTFYLLKVFVLA